MWLAERGAIGRMRAQLLGGLHGDVLEIGAGTGLNFPHYGAAARVRALEPDPAMLARARKRAARSRAAIALERAGDERLADFAAASYDAVVFTFVLCTLADPVRALASAKRLLRPGGTLTLIEHVRSGGRLGRRQDRLAPLWAKLAGGCQLNRETRALVRQAGFDPAGLRNERIPGILIRDLLAGSITTPSA